MNNLNDANNQKPKTYYCSNLYSVNKNRNENKSSLSKRIINRCSKISGNLAFIAASGAMANEYHNEFIKCFDLPITFSNFKSISINFGLTNIGILSVVAGSAVLGYQLKNLISRNIQNQKN